MQTRDDLQQRIQARIGLVIEFAVAALFGVVIAGGLVSTFVWLCWRLSR